KPSGFTGQTGCSGQVQFQLLFILFILTAFAGARRRLRACLTLGFPANRPETYAPAVAGSGCRLSICSLTTLPASRNAVVASSVSSFFVRMASISEALFVLRYSR